MREQIEHAGILDEARRSRQSGSSDLERKAVELTRHLDADILDALAVALAANDELEEAVAVREERIRLMVGKNVTTLTVADAEAALGRYRGGPRRSDESIDEENQGRPIRQTRSSLPPTCGILDLAGHDSRRVK